MNQQTISKDLINPEEYGISWQNNILTTRWN